MPDLLGSTVTAVIAVVLALRLGRRWQANRQAHTLVYTAALALMALAAVLDLIFGLAGRWPAAGYALYWVAASGLVVTMGAGCAYMAHRGFGHVMLAVTVLLVGWTAALAFGLDLPGGGVAHGPLVALQAPAELKSAFRASSYVGALLLLGFALWSWVRTRQAYTLYFALTAVAFTLAGILGGRMASPAAFYLLQAAGALFLYAGVSGSLSARAGAPNRHTLSH